MPALSPPQIASQSENPLPWLAAYFRTRAHLAAYASDFHCDPACTRPGCKNQDLQVPVNLIDLLGVALHRDDAVSANYQRHYSLGLLANGRDDWLRLVSLRLQKPCPYLIHDRCGIYPVRPLPCVLFPEYLVAAGTFEAHAREDHFRDYLCFRSPIRLSPERARAIAQLRIMWERENLISSYYLFNHGSCYVDFSNLIQELLDETAGLEERPTQIIPHRVLERFLLDRLARYQPLFGVSEKILPLNTPEGQERLLQLLQDELLVKQLKQADRTLVCRFARGKLKAKRRSLTPREYNFVG